LHQYVAFDTDCASNQIVGEDLRYLFLALFPG
jgi:hypothetical protein